MSPAATIYAELVAATNFSFLRGASHPQDMVLSALLLGQTGIGIADRNSVAGVVRAYAALKELRAEGTPLPGKVREGSGPGEFAFQAHDSTSDDPAAQEALRRCAEAFKLVVGARLVFADGSPEIVAYPTDRAAWGRLCRLLTLGNRRTGKGGCILHLSDLLADPAGLLLIVLPERRLDGLAAELSRIAEAAPGAVWLGIALHRRGDDLRRLARAKVIAGSASSPEPAISRTCSPASGRA